MHQYLFLQSRWAFQIIRMVSKENSVHYFPMSPLRVILRTPTTPPWGNSVQSSVGPQWRRTLVHRCISSQRTIAALLGEALRGQGGNLQCRDILQLGTCSLVALNHQDSSHDSALLETSSIYMCSSFAFPPPPRRQSCHSTASSRGEQCSSQRVWPTHLGIADLAFSDGWCDVWEMSVNRSRCWLPPSCSRPWILEAFWLLSSWYLRFRGGGCIYVFICPQDKTSQDMSHKDIEIRAWHEI